jgi:hypothetical protein
VHGVHDVPWCQRPEHTGGTRYAIASMPSIVGLGRPTRWSSTRFARPCRSGTAGDAAWTSRARPTVTRYGPTAKTIRQRHHPFGPPALSRSLGAWSTAGRAVTSDTGSPSLSGHLRQRRG